MKSTHMTAADGPMYQLWLPKDPVLGYQEFIVEGFPNQSSMKRCPLSASKIWKGDVVGHKGHLCEVGPIL